MHEKSYTIMEILSGTLLVLIFQIIKCNIMDRINIKPSGITLVDEKWGGMYNNSSYLMIGPRKSGRSLMALQFAIESAKQKQVCLFFSSARPMELMILAASANIDLEYYMSKNLIIVVKVASPEGYVENLSNDIFRADFLADIIRIVEENKPNKIVFDELTPLIGFNDPKVLRKTYGAILEAIEDSGVTSLFIIGEPDSEKAKLLVDVLVSYSTGIIYLSKSENEGFPQGEMTIVPYVGHNEGRFSAQYMAGGPSRIIDNHDNPTIEEISDSDVIAESI